MSSRSGYRPGEDSKVISTIANEFYGGFEPMFIDHDWPERGQDMMRKVQSRVADTYGSVVHFQHVHNEDNPFKGDTPPTVMLTSFWGFDPASWGCIGFTKRGRRTTIIKETTNPFLMVCYVTETAGRNTPQHLWGKVAGFYEVTHIEGPRPAFMPDWQAEYFPDKWWYSIKATRAWEILPEFMPSIRDFDPTLHTEKRERSVSANAEFLAPNLVEKLKSLPRREVPVYGSAKPIDQSIRVPGNRSRQYVSGGSGRSNGYEVGEPKETEKELYILQLCGDEAAYLGADPEGKKIIKIGLSLSPQIRCDFFQKNMPHGAFKWDILKSTRRDDHPRYADFKTAEAGEMAMKKHLSTSSSSDWLGGEFYLVSDEIIQETWRIGRDAALQYQKDNTQ